MLFLTYLLSKHYCIFQTIGRSRVTKAQINTLRAEKIFMLKVWIIETVAFFLFFHRLFYICRLQYCYNYNFFMANIRYCNWSICRYWYQSIQLRVAPFLHHVAQNRVEHLVPDRLGYSHLFWMFDPEARSIPIYPILSAWANATTNRKDCLYTVVLCSSSASQWPQLYTFTHLIVFRVKKNCMALAEIHFKMCLSLLKKVPDPCSICSV